MADSKLYTATTILEHERLIQSLYTPGADVSRIQDILHKYQRLPQGWRFADVLLQSQDPKVRFFGALTFTVKINNDWETLSTEDSTSLLDRLLHWLVQLTTRGEGTLVLKKLCSTLVVYLFRPSVIWDHCFRHVVCCFARREVASSQMVSSMPPTSHMLSLLDTSQVRTILWFAAALVEEASKISPNSIQTYVFARREH